MKFFKIFSILFYLTLSVSAQKTYVLKQNFPIGKKYTFSMVSDQIINQEISGQKINLNQNIGTDYIFDIRNGDNMSKDIDVVYSRIFMKSSGMGNTMMMDSNDPDTTKVNPFRGIKGASFRMEIAPDGSIKSLTGIDAMLNKMTFRMSKDSSVIRSLKTSLAKQFNSEGMKQTMESSLKIYPEKPVKIGESWTVDTKMQMTMPIETITKYTLKEVKNGVAYLNISGSLTSKGDFETMGNKMQTDLTGTNNGDVELDMKTGLILKSHLRIELAGTMSAMGQMINFELQGINKMTGNEMQKNAILNP
ncbi:hypothetical protein ASE92_00655 [Pedobacter sp. Leaf41]|jgi:hypothetical protein|uniref:DUF6263 family protein n=1 Tax=Pedobacter sp. Leaf41 TaxID=1736218 RepID=UPI0007033102|nr:DUF6263 family protein [Pedobacter sp. Leaf41]KQN37991.1 hypothetical protein ASE92_00655 [Pedobacter sp. Leaf41]